MTREELLNIIETDHVQCGEAAALARMALAFYEWHEKTAWVQTDKRFDVLLPWGKHRADVLKEYIEHLENRITQVSEPVAVVPKNCVTAEHRRVIEMLLNVCGAAFELADDSCQQDVDGEDCHVVPDDTFQKLSDALDEIENTLPTEDIDRPDVFLAWSAMPRAALKSILQPGNSPVIPDGWKMVPKEPTEEMLQASYREAAVYSPTAYRAMLAAAPQETDHV